MPGDQSAYARQGIGLMGCLFAAYFLLTVALQIASGAYRSELSHWPDEAAHVTTSLLFRDYLVSGFHETPLAFAKDYYAHYPKIAIGMWPPFFYLVAGIWMLVFGATQTSLLALVAVATALLATTVTLVARRIAGLLPGIFAGLTLLGLPHTQGLTSMVMIDVPVALMQFWAMCLLVRFFQTGRTRHAVWFGIFASLALLTKANANSLALLPPILLVLTGSYFLLKRRGLYVAALIAAGIGMPWQIVSFRMQQTSVPIAHLDMARVVSSAAFYLRQLNRDLGPGLLILAAVGAGWGTYLLLRKESSVPLEAGGAIALLAATLVFHSIVPTPLDDRYILSALPPAILCALVGLKLVADKLRGWLAQAPAAAAAGCLGAAALLACPFQIPQRPEMGYARVADFIARTEPNGAVVLVCSDADGEGALVEELALREARPNRFVLRATKVLSDNAWSPSEHRPLVSSAADLGALLDRARVAMIVIDETNSVWEQDRQLLQETVSAAPHEWRLIPDVATAGTARKLSVYRRTGSPDTPRGPIRIPLHGTLGIDLTLP